MTDITLTSAAAAHFKKILARHPMAPGILFSLRDSGCSEYSYVLKIAEQHMLESDYVVNHSHEIALYTPVQHLAKLTGTCIDAEPVGVNNMIKFLNPNAAAACGCGESFSLKTPE